MISAWWVGQRAADAEGLGDDVTRVIACQGGPSAAVLSSTYALESLTGAREAWSSADLDQCVDEIAALDPHALEVDRSADSVHVVPYRPLTFLERLESGMPVCANSVQLFDELDSNITGTYALGAAGLVNYRFACLPVGGLSFVDAVRKVGMPFIVKRPISCAGNGCYLIRNRVDLGRAREQLGDGRALIAEYVPGATYNVHGVVLTEGEVMTWPPSRQLVGRSELTSNPLGYCGNLFGCLDRRRSELLDRITTELGSWLRLRGYRGVFGADVVLAGTTVHIVDLNPRFQSSTLLASFAGGARGPIGLAHRAAFDRRIELNTGRSDAAPALDRRDKVVVQAVVRQSPDRPLTVDSQLSSGVYRWQQGASDLALVSPRVRMPRADEVVLLDLPPLGVRLAPGAALCRCWRLDVAVESDGSPELTWCVELRIALERALDHAEVRA